MGGKRTKWLRVQWARVTPKKLRTNRAWRQYKRLWAGLPAWEKAAIAREHR